LVGQKCPTYETDRRLKRDGDNQEMLQQPDGLIANPPAEYSRFPLDRWWLAAFVFLAARAVVAFVDYPSLAADPDAYRALAEGWSSSGTFGRAAPDGMVTATAYRPPLYPWLLSWFVGNGSLWLPGVAVLHVLLGCVTSLLTWDIARRLTQARSKASMAIAWIAGMMVALDPILLRQSSLLMTETAATFMAVVIWWIWLLAIRKEGDLGLLSAIALGSLLGLSCLLRSSWLVWCPILIGLSVFARYPFHRNRSRQSRAGSELVCRNEMVLIAVMFLVLVPWAVRNRVVLGSTIWTTTHGGYTLLLANNPVLFKHYEEDGGSRKWDEDRFHRRWSQRGAGDPRLSDFWDAAEVRGPAMLISNEVIDDQLASQSAWATILRSPALFAKACFIRIGWFWAFWPSSEQASWPLRMAIGTWYGLSILLFAYGSARGILGWWTCRIAESVASRWLPAVALVIGLTAVHAVYWSNMRMRAPLIPIVAVVAAWTLVSFTTRDLNRR
jgi:hypothetical protein